MDLVAYLHFVLGLGELGAQVLCEDLESFKIVRKYFVYH